VDVPTGLLEKEAVATFAAVRDGAAKMNSSIGAPVSAHTRHISASSADASAASFASSPDGIAAATDAACA